LGRKEEALNECRRAVELRPISRDALEGPEYATNLAVVYGWIGDHDLAIEQLSALVRDTSWPKLGELKLDPVWDDLRGDPRFAQIMSDAAKPIPISRSGRGATFDGCGATCLPLSCVEISLTPAFRPVWRNLSVKLAVFNALVVISP